MSSPPQKQIKRPNVECNGNTMTVGFGLPARNDTIVTDANARLDKNGETMSHSDLIALVGVMEEKSIVLSSIQARYRAAILHSHCSDEPEVHLVVREAFILYREAYDAHVQSCVAVAEAAIDRMQDFEDAPESLYGNSLKS